MEHNDIRRAFCYNCPYFRYNEAELKWWCDKLDVPLRLGKHKVPQKEQLCGGPYESLEANYGQ